MPLPVNVLSDVLCSLVIAIRSSITVCVLKIKFYISEFIFLVEATSSIVTFTSCCTACSRSSSSLDRKYHNVYFSLKLMS